nr:3',5'-cyclic-AMP phosphodiesterase [Shewanella intestini]
MKNDSVRLVQMTDPHLFADPDSQLLGVNTANSFNAVMDTFLANGHHADLLLATGDISQDYSPESYHDFTEYVTKLDLPCHYLPGNHDDPRLMSLHMQGAHMFGQQLITIGDWQIIMLDSTLRGKPSGYLNDSQIELIDFAIKKSPHLNVLLCMHHNPVLVGCKWLDQHCMANGSEFLETVSQYPQVKGILWGHVHQTYEQQYQGQHGKIALMATPSTCIQFKPKSSYFALDGVQPGYRLLDLHSDGSIHSQVYRVPGDHFTPDNEASGY